MPARRDAFQYYLALTFLRNRSLYGLGSCLSFSDSLGRADYERTIEEMVEAGEPLIQEAITALRHYHEAQVAGEAPDKVERLRLIAESAYQAVNDYQLYALGRQPLTKH